jgi:acyl dehydratase
VVFTVRMAVCAVEPLIVTEAGILHVAGSRAARGAIPQLRLTAPVKPPDGVRVMVEVLPVDAPGKIVIAAPVIVKLGGMV